MFTPCVASLALAPFQAATSCALFPDLSPGFLCGNRRGLCAGALPLTSPSKGPSLFGTLVRCAKQSLFCHVWCTLPLAMGLPESEDFSVGRVGRSKLRNGDPLVCAREARILPFPFRSMCDFPWFERKSCGKVSTWSLHDP